MTFKTMLAGKALSAEGLPLPMLASPKLDGVRCHVINGVAVSRNLLPFRNPQIQDMFGRQEFNGLDGELMVGDPTHPEAFRQTGLLNSHSGDCSEVKFFVFDDFTFPDAPFSRRLEDSAKRVLRQNLLRNPTLARVDHKLIYNEEQLNHYEAECLDKGYEGVMLRITHGRYKFGRSTYREALLLKLKRFEDSEAVIDGANEKMHNANEKTLVKNGKAVRNSKKEGKVPMGVLGSVECRDIHDGRPVDVGSGFSDAERAALWQMHQRGELVGKVIKYQFFPTGSKDRPRFPTFKGFRDEGDI